jgi:hypothetical protein
MCVFMANTTMIGAADDFPRRLVRGGSRLIE